MDYWRPGTNKRLVMGEFGYNNEQSAMINLSNGIDYLPQ